MVPAVRPLVLALVLLFAGCVSNTGTPPVPVPLQAFVDPIVDDHDHSDIAEHALSTPSMSLLAHTTLSGNDSALSYIGEIDTWKDLSIVQVVGRGSMPGFVVLDVSEVAQPRVIGRAEMPFSYVVDVKFSPDGTSAFAASQIGTRRDRGHSPATDDPLTAVLTGNGFTQFDMSDPTAPKAIAGALVETDGCHMLSVKELGGKLTVFCVASVVLVFQYQASGAWERVASLTPGASGEGVQQALGDLTAALLRQDTGETRSLKPHDITVVEDPKQAGRWLALVSYWDFGLRIFDVTDPLNPQELSAWAGEGAPQYGGDFHGAVIGMLDGKRVLVGTTETIRDRIPALWVLDVDDLSKPTIISEWVPPGAHSSQGLTLTTHQLQIVGGRVYMTYNHAGIWVLDLARLARGGFEDDPARAEVLGYYLPHALVNVYNGTGLPVPDTWDLNVKDGAILATDRYTGLYVVRYTGDTLGDASIVSVT